jgi:DNA modification methylase
VSFTVHVGDCITSMRAMPDQSVHTCVTSPPYFGLRDYGHEGQIGLEPTPDAFVARLVEVFREVRRVLRDDGTLWLNLGDSYASSTKGSGGKGKSTLGAASGGNGISPEGIARSQARQSMDVRKLSCGLDDKQLLGIPWRVAFALQADGWYLRQDIIWHKPNPMPESVTDRCTKSHEYIFMFSKSARYYFDHEAIKEPSVSDHKSNNGFKRDARESYKNPDGTSRGNDQQWDGVGGLRNKRSVWTVTSKPFAGAHFATFPPDLIEPCVLAGCPIGGVVLDPFGGSGTTAGVAVKHRRRAVLCELNPAYADLIEARVQAIAGETPDMFPAGAS